MSKDKAEKAEKVEKPSKVVRPSTAKAPSGPRLRVPDGMTSICLSGKSIPVKAGMITVDADCVAGAVRLGCVLIED